MSILSNFSIGKKLGAAFGILMLLMVAVAATAWMQINHIGGNLNAVADNTVPSLRALGDMRDLIQQLRRFELRHVIAQGADKTEAETKVKELNAKFAKGVKDYEPLIADDNERKLIEVVVQKVAEAEKSRQVLFAMSRDKTKAAATQSYLMKESTAFYNASNNAIGEVLTYNTKMADAASADGKATLKLATQVLAALSTVALILGVLLAWSITRSITAPMTIAVDVAKKVADGDLNAKFEISGKDEVATLMRELEKMVHSLQGVISQVKSASDQIATASSEIAQGNTDLSARTENQASSLQQTAASMEQLTGTVKQNAESAKQANQLASAASEDASRGGEVVEKVVGTMNDISEQSKRIADIIGVIDGIAFQTNILALNAAVEAARAGEQGRGFAVVAGEVRNLAQRSAQAAKEIKSLITDSVEKVDSGSKLVGEAGKSMQEIVTSVRRVSDIIGEITAATIEQSSGIEQVNQAVTQLDETTQQNAALVEQSAAAAASLKDQAYRLTESVSVFKLDQHSVRALPAPTSAPVKSAGGSPAKVTPKAVKPALAKPAAAKPEPVKSAPKSNEDEWEEF